MNDRSGMNLDAPVGEMYSGQHEQLLTEVGQSGLMFKNYLIQTLQNYGAIVEFQSKELCVHRELEWRIRNKQLEGDTLQVLLDKIADVRVALTNAMQEQQQKRQEAFVASGQSSTGGAIQAG